MDEKYNNNNNKKLTEKTEIIVKTEFNP